MWIGSTLWAQHTPTSSENYNPFQSLHGPHCFASMVRLQRIVYSLEPISFSIMYRRLHITTHTRVVHIINNHWKQAIFIQSSASDVVQSCAVECIKIVCVVKTKTFSTRVLRTVHAMHRQHIYTWHEPHKSNLNKVWNVGYQLNIHPAFGYATILIGTLNIS